MISLIRVVFVGVALVMTFSATQAQDLGFVNYNFNQGLHHTQIVDISQDNYGNLWLLPYTSNTIYRFDGVRFERFLITVAGISKPIKPYRVAADKELIWIFSNEGLLSFDGRTFKDYKPDSSFKAGNGSSLFVDQSRHVWAIDDYGQVMSKFSNDSTFNLRKIQSKGTPLGFFEADGELFLYTDYSETISLKTLNSVELPWLADEQDFSLVKNDGNTIIIVSANRITSYDPESKQKITGHASGFNFVNTIDAFIDRQNRFWILAEGLIHLIDHDQLRRIDSQAGFTDAQIFKVFKDKSNSLWFGSNSEGIFHYSEKELIHVPVPEKEVISTIFPYKKDKLLAGTFRHGIIEIANDEAKGNIFDGVSSQTIGSITSGPDNSLIIGTLTDGAFCLRLNGTLVKINTGKLNKEQYILPALYNRKTLWLGSLAGLHRFSNSLEPLNVYPLEKLGVGKEIYSISPYGDEQLLLGTAGDGLMTFDINTQQVKAIPGIEKTAVVYSVKIDSAGRTWVGGEFPELIVLDENLKVLSRIGLSNYCNNIWSMEFIDRNEILFGSNDGLFKMELDQYLHMTSIKKLGRVDGYNGGEIFLGSMRKVGDRIWFGTTEGAYAYEPKRDLEQAERPITYIRDVRLFNKETDWAPYSSGLRGLYGLPENLKLDHNDDNITFSFFGTDYYNSENMKYRYYLKGIDTGWSDYVNNEQVNYSNLDPGKYTFVVQARSSTSADGNEASFTFEILPAFWQTTWFRVGLLAFVGILLVLMIRYFLHSRIRQFQLREEVRAAEIVKLRKQMSMDFHDEMGNKLASLLAYVNALKLRADGKPHIDLLNYFESSAAAIYSGTRDFIWSIDVESNNLKEVIMYIRDFGVDLFEKNNIEFIVENDILNESHNVQLPDGYNRNLILLFKEAMTNALKHANCRRVRFDVSRIDNGHRITLEDDGKGVNGSRHGKGMTSMSNRAIRINGALAIQPNQPTGTRVSLEFKI